MLFIRKYINIQVTNNQNFYEYKSYDYYTIIKKKLTKKLKI